MSEDRPPFGVVKESTDLERPHKRLGKDWALDSSVKKIVTYDGEVVTNEGVVVTN